MKAGLVRSFFYVSLFKESGVSCFKVIRGMGEIVLIVPVAKTAVVDRSPMQYNAFEKFQHMSTSFSAASMSWWICGRSVKFWQICQMQVSTVSTSGAFASTRVKCDRLAASINCHCPRAMAYLNKPLLPYIWHWTKYCIDRVEASRRSLLARWKLKIDKLGLCIGQFVSVRRFPRTMKQTKE